MDSFEISMALVNHDEFVNKSLRERFPIPLPWRPKRQHCKISK